MDLKAFLARYLKSKRGNIALIVALSIFPICLLSGGTVEESAYLSAKSSAQEALDAAALAAAKSGATDVPTIQATMTSVYAANIANKAAQGSTLQTPTYDSVQRRVYAEATGYYKTIFLNLIGYPQLQYAVKTSTLIQANGTLEVALVLDNTYSMSQSLDGTNSKLAVLKTAALGLVSTIMTPQNAGNVKIGVVPYGDYVNVGTNNAGQSWLSVPANYSTTSAPATPPCYKTTTTCTGQTTTTCTSTSTHDGVTTTTTSSCKTGGTCTTTKAVTTCPAPTTTNYKWFGCVYPQWGGSGIAMPDPAAPYVGFLTTSLNCNTPITPLTGTSTTVNAAINAMVDQVGGTYPNTYIPGGLLWGINVLSPAAPFSEGAAYDPKNKVPRKAIVLMTDGFNTDWLTSAKLNGVGTAGGTPAQEATAYADEAALCAYAKSKNIEIYTIGVGVTDANSLAALQSCATDAGHYFNVQSSGGLVSAFDSIAKSLQNLRIAS